MPTWLFGLLVGATIVSLGVGVMLGLAWVTGRGDDRPCDGEVDVGYAPNLIEAAAVEPFFQAINERCQYWLAIDAGGDVVAYKTTLPGRDCSVRWDIELTSWRCGATAVDASDLERWPVRVDDTDDGPPTLVIDFGPAL